MPKRKVRRGVSNRIRRIARVGIIAAILILYSAYWVATPTQIEIPEIEGSSIEGNVLRVSLHNPTYKFVTGKIYRVEALVDLPSARGGTTILQSVPDEYPFNLLPQSTSTLDIPMNSRVLPGFDYDVYLQVDGVGKQTLTIALPKTAG